jgi:hypothetical protein
LRFGALPAVRFAWLVHRLRERAGLPSHQNGVERLLGEAIQAGELRHHANPAELARSIEALLSGSMIVWGFYLKGRADKWMRQDLEALLGPWLVRT